MMIATIAYGNRTGQYFTQWRFDELEWLLNMVQEGPMPDHNEKVEVTDARIWYDQNEDFHWLSFNARGHAVAVRFYKVFAATIDGVDYGITWRRSAVWSLAVGIRKQLGVQPVKLTDDSPDATDG